MQRIEIGGAGPGMVVMRQEQHRRFWFKPTWVVVETIWISKRQIKLGVDAKFSAERLTRQLSWVTKEHGNLEVPRGLCQTCGGCIYIVCGCPYPPCTCEGDPENVLPKEY